MWHVQEKQDGFPLITAGMTNLLNTVGMTDEGFAMTVIDYFLWTIFFPDPCHNLALLSTDINLKFEQFV